MPLMPLVADGDWSDEIAEAIAPELRARISVSTEGTNGTYDGDSDEHTGGTDGAPLLADRKARARRLKPPVPTAGADDYRVPVIWRWTIIAETGDPIIPEDAILTVLDGGRATELTGTTQRVRAATRSTEGSLLFIEAKADG